MQDIFCKSNDMYVVCIGKSQGQITSFSGTKPEEDFVDVNFTPELRREIVDSFIDGVADNVVERFGTEEYLMYRGVAIRGAEGKMLGVWLCFGVDKNTLPIEKLLAPEIKLTTADAFDKSIFLIETLTKYYFTEKLKANILRQELAQQKNAELEIEYKLKKNEIMTSAYGVREFFF